MTDAAFREGVRAIVGELRHLRGSIDAVLAALAPDEPVPTCETAPAVCPHPDEHVVTFGVTDGQEDWLCKVCGYRSVHEGAPA